MSRRVRLRSMGLAALLVLVLVACGQPAAEPGGALPPGTSSSPDGSDPASPADHADPHAEVVAAIEGLDPDAREARLLELAQQVDADFYWYTTLSGGLQDTVAKAFEAKYDIPVIVFRANDETLYQRLSSEQESQFAGADVVEIHGETMVQLASEGALLPYESHRLDALVEGSVFDGWVADRYTIWAMSWNTDLVAEDEIPQAWTDLTDPKWDGRMAMEMGDAGWYKELWEYWVEDQGSMTEREADEAFQAMADGAIFIRGHAPLRQLLAAGEYAVATSNYTYTLEASIAEGAPVAWQPAIEPIILQANGAAPVRYGNNPAAAILFIDWLLGPEAQQLYVDNHLAPALAELSTTGELETIHMDWEDFVANSDHWIGRYEQLAQLGEVREG